MACEKIKQLLDEEKKQVAMQLTTSTGSTCEADKLRLGNPHLTKMDEDILYHIGLGSRTHDLKKMFGDVKYVVVGGTPRRMEQFAYYIKDELKIELPTGTTLNDISKHSHRYAMFKIGPVLSVSHGMGMPSIGILLHELFKLMYYAEVANPIFVRICTCGGVGVKAGTVVVSKEVVNDYLKSEYNLTILGEEHNFVAKLDQDLANELISLSKPTDSFEVQSGKTLCTDSFYEGSGRMDGAICEFSDAEGLDYYKNYLMKNGVVNIEMESLALAALTCRAGIKSAIICVVLSDRLETDLIKQPRTVLEEWQTRPQVILARYIKNHIGVSQESSSVSNLKTPEHKVVPDLSSTEICPGISKCPSMKSESPSSSVSNLKTPEHKKCRSMKSESPSSSVSNLKTPEHKVVPDLSSTEICPGISKCPSMKSESPSSSVSNLKTPEHKKCRSMKSESPSSSVSNLKTPEHKVVPDLSSTEICPRISKCPSMKSESPSSSVSNLKTPEHKVVPDLSSTEICPRISKCPSMKSESPSVPRRITSDSETTKSPSLERNAKLRCPLVKDTPSGVQSSVPSTMKTDSECPIVACDRNVSTTESSSGRYSIRKCPKSKDTPTSDPRRSLSSIKTPESESPATESRQSGSGSSSEFSGCSTVKCSYVKDTPVSDGRKCSVKTPDAKCSHVTCDGNVKDTPTSDGQRSLSSVKTPDTKCSHVTCDRSDSVPDTPRVIKSESSSPTVSSSSPAKSSCESCDSNVVKKESVKYSTKTSSSFSTKSKSSSGSVCLPCTNLEPSPKSTGSKSTPDSVTTTKSCYDQCLKSKDSTKSSQSDSSVKDEAKDRQISTSPKKPSFKEVKSKHLGPCCDSEMSRKPPRHVVPEPSPCCSDKLDEPYQENKACQDTSRRSFIERESLLRRSSASSQSIKEESTTNTSEPSRESNSKKCTDVTRSPSEGSTSSEESPNSATTADCPKKKTKKDFCYKDSSSSMLFVSPHIFDSPWNRTNPRANKYDESISPCSDCKKFQISRNQSSVSDSQPELIRCPHKLKKLKDECEGYE